MTLSISILMLMACTSQPNSTVAQSVVLPLNEKLFEADTIAVIDEEQLFSLSDQQQQDFLTYHRKEVAKGVKDHQIVSNYLLNYISKFTYYGENYTATEALSLNKGNCMSLAVLTVALAKLINVEFDFREVNTLPMFEKHGSLLLSSSHVQTRLFDPSFEQPDNEIVLTRPSLVIDYFPDKNNVKSRYISYLQFLSMYYQNITADAMIAGDLDLAFANAKAAYAYDPSSVRVHNLLGVLHRRIGDTRTAETIYKQSLLLERENLSLLNNYIVLLEAQSRTFEASQLKVKMNKLDDTNPYSWLEQAYIYRNSAKFDLAIRYYEKVIRLAPYISQAYLGLYQSYQATAQYDKAKSTLEKGLEWTYMQTERQVFKYKLYGNTNTSPPNGLSVEF